MDSLDTTTKTKVKPSSYKALSFHGIRLLSAACSIVAGSILAGFIIALKNDGYKVPFSFLIGVLAAALTLIVLVVTLCIHSCMRLSPLFNLVLNVPLLIVWLVLTGLIGYNIMGTLSRSCTLSNWGNNDGMMICQQYKALFSFVVFASLSQLAMVIVDVRARIAKNRSGKYSQMPDSTAQLKMEPYNSTLNRQTSFQDAPFPATQPQRRDTYEEQLEQYTQNYEYHDDQPGWRPGQRTETNATPYAAQAIARKPIARTDTTVSTEYMARTNTLASSQHAPHMTNTYASSNYGEVSHRGNSGSNSNYGEIPHRNNTVASSHYNETPPVPMPMPHRNNTVASSHYSEYSDIGGVGGQQMRMQHFDNDHYHQPVQNTGYDSTYGQQQYTAYNPRY